MNFKRIREKTIVGTLLVACIALAVLLALAMVNSESGLENKNSQIAVLQTSLNGNLTEINTLKEQISNLQNLDAINLTRQMAEKDAHIANLTAEIESLNAQIISIDDQLNKLSAQIAKNLTSELSFQEKIRDSVMDYIQFNHPETQAFMQNLNWTGGRMTPPHLLGAENYSYTCAGWKFTMTYPVVLNPIYTITADYSAAGVSIPYRIIWQGSWQNWCINETSYTFAQ
jgi:cell division protein FtsB